jgi:phage-related protein (TIGR01555 family)
MSWYDRALSIFRPSPRLDAAPLPADLTPSRGSVVNDLSGLGLSSDYAAQSRPNTDRRYLDANELAALTSHGMYWWMCGFYPMLATYRGITITDDSDDIAPMSAELEDLAVLPSLAAGACRGQAYGDAYLLINVEDGRKWSEPLDPARVRRLNALTPIAASELLPDAWETDSASPEWSNVARWQFSPNRNGVSFAATTIHHTRLIRFYGIDPGPEQQQSRMATIWQGHAGIAMGQPWNDALMGLGSIDRAAARLASAASVTVLKIADAELKMGADTRSTFLQHMQLIAKGMSLFNSVLLTPADDMQRLGANATGFWDLYRIAVGHLAAVSRIPQSAMFGEAPGGLTTDNEAGWRMAEANALDFWQTRIRPGLKRVVACMYAAKRSRAVWQIAMNPLGALSPKEQAEIRAIHTTADSTAIADGVLTPEQVARSRYGEYGWRNEIQPATAEEEGPDASAMAEAMKEQQDADFTGKALLCVRLSEAGRLAWSDLVSAAEAIVGPLEGYAVGEGGIQEPPHLTVLYLGAVPSAAVSDIEARARVVVEAMPPFALPVRRLYVLPAGPASEGRLPVVAEIDAWEVRDLNAALLRVLAHHVTAEQFPTFRAHVTLGFAREIGGEQLAKLAEVPLVHEEQRRTLGSAGGVEVVYDQKVWATLPLLGRRTE